MEPLLRLCHRWVASYDQAVAQAIASVWGRDPDVVGTSCPNPEILETALAASPRSPLVDAVAAAVDEFVWFTPPASVPEVMRSHAVATELVGPDGAYVDGSVRFGLMAVAPDTIYPPHRHAAAEHYLVIAGGAWFSVDSADYRWRQAEDAQLTPPGSWHALRTVDEPLLTLYTWSGDVSFDSYELEP